MKFHATSRLKIRKRFPLSLNIFKHKLCIIPSYIQWLCHGYLVCIYTSNQYTLHPIPYLHLQRIANNLAHHRHQYIYRFFFSNLFQSPDPRQGKIIHGLDYIYLFVNSINLQFGKLQITSHHKDFCLQIYIYIYIFICIYIYINLPNETYKFSQKSSQIHPICIYNIYSIYKYAMNINLGKLLQFLNLN